LWEQRQALASLRQLGREQVDEAALFRMIRQMRDIVDTVQHTTRKARRDQERRQHLRTQSPSGKLAPPATDVPDAPNRRPTGGYAISPDRGMVAMDEFPALDLSHLLPGAQGLARLPAAERIQRIRADRWIGYPRVTANSAIA
jgi:hypothetical protein